MERASTDMLMDVKTSITKSKKKDIDGEDSPIMAGAAGVAAPGAGSSLMGQAGVGTVLPPHMLPPQAPTVNVGGVPGVGVGVSQQQLQQVQAQQRQRQQQAQQAQVRGVSLVA